MRAKLFVLLLPLLLLSQAHAGDPGKLYFRWHYFLTNAGRNKPVLSGAPDLYDVGPKCWANIGVGYEVNLAKCLHYQTQIVFHPYYVTFSPIGLQLISESTKNNVQFGGQYHITAAICARNSSGFTYTFNHSLGLLDKVFWGFTAGPIINLQTKYGQVRVGIEFQIAQSYMQWFNDGSNPSVFEILRGYKNNPYNDGFTQLQGHFSRYFTLSDSLQIHGINIALCYILKL